MIILAVMVAGATYWWRDNKAAETEKNSQVYASSLRQTIVSLNGQLLDEKIKNNSANQIVCGETVGAPVQNTIKNITTAINNGNPAALLGYMATNVSILHVESGLITNNSQTQAVNEISNFISNNSSFWDYDFSLPASDIGMYLSGAYGKYFPSSAVIGRSGDNRIISFSFDCKNQISVILVARNEKLLI